MLLYTDSTDSVTNNEVLLNDVYQCMADDILTVLKNGGSQVFNNLGMLSIYPLFEHVSKYLMAMILSISDVDDIPVMRVTIDTEIRKYIIVRIVSGKLY